LSKLGQAHSLSLLSGIGASRIAYNNALTEPKKVAAGVLKEADGATSCRVELP
jgi:hypothetical protein